jgi:DNA-binding beta-propeller fold protein YncE
MRRRDFLALGAAAPLLRGQPGVAGNHLIYVGAYPNVFYVIDEATEKVVDRIPMTKGTPRGTTLSDDKKRFYVVADNMEDVEVVDIPNRKVVDTFRLSEGNRKIRVRGAVAVDPQQNYAILLTKSATKHLDRWDIGANTILQYDLKAKKVMRTIPWPKGEEREFANFKFSPDGRNLFLFGDDITVLDTRDFKEIDKWELSKPLENGLGRISLGPSDDTYEEPGYSTGLFFVQDAVQNRRIMGIARVNLSQRSVDFYALGPQFPVTFALSPDRKWGYGVHEEIGRWEFWTFDLVNRRVHSRREFPGRSRMGLKPSSNGKVLYIYVAGNTIDLYDAQTYRYLRTITIDGDMSTNMFILPRA